MSNENLVFRSMFQNISNEFAVSKPQVFKNLTIFPIIGNKSFPEVLPYTTLEEEVTIKEVNDQGSVPHLLAINETANKVVIYEGEILEGLKQTRVVNTSVILDSNSKTNITVSCVERGSWSHRTARARSAHRFYDPELRFQKMKSIRTGLEAGRGYYADQSRVWGDIEQELNYRSKVTPTSSYLGAYDDKESYEFSKGRDAFNQKNFETYLKDEAEEAVFLLDNQVGYVITVNGKIISFELFDSNNSLKIVWDKLFRSFLTVAERKQKEDKLFDVTYYDVVSWLDDFSNSEIKNYNSAGIGKMSELTVKNSFASLLTLNENLIHAVGFKDQSTEFNRRYQTIF